MIGHVDLLVTGIAEATVGLYGMTVVSLDSFNAGAVPDPSVDLVDWYYLDGFYLDEGANSALRVNRFPFDIRTARKIRGEDRTLVFVLDNNSAAGFDVKFSVFTRLLLQG